MIKKLFIILAVSGGLTVCPAQGQDSQLTGKWVRIGMMGPVSIQFNENGLAEGDFGMDGNIEIKTAWHMDKNRLIFEDMEGVTCPEPGIYEISMTEHYLSFNYVEDLCGGRVKWTMGFWVRPGYQEAIDDLSEKIRTEPSPDDFAARGRMYMAIGKTMEARQDFDSYIAMDPGEGRIFLNRASTRFPADMKGAVEDCNRAIELLQKGAHVKLALFLRGLARYELGEHEEACADFQKAIELGFTILKDAEKERCSAYWSAEGE